MISYVDKTGDWYLDIRDHTSCLTLRYDYAWDNLPWDNLIWAKLLIESPLWIDLPPWCSYHPFVPRTD